MDGTGEPVRIAVLDYGAGNVRSARRGFEAAGADVVITDDPEVGHRADVVVVPGVGHFSTCLAALRRSGMVALLEERIVRERAVFGICVGMQILYERSDEGNEPGLGLLPGHVQRFPEGTLVPHLGWDTIRAAEHAATADELLTGVAGEQVYFVHSYYAVPREDAHVIARCSYGGVDFPSLVTQGSVIGTQFHPEKSGQVGTRLLRNWLSLLHR